jgi:hypothetical protein
MPAENPALVKVTVPAIADMSATVAGLSSNGGPAT